MTRPFEALPELTALLDALCEETITPEQLRRLEELVLSHPEAEAYYVQYLSFYAHLGQHFSSLPGLAEQSLRVRLGAEPHAPAVPEKTRKRPARYRRPHLLPVVLALTGLAAAVLLVLMLWPRPTNGPVPVGPPAEEVDLTVAVLVQAPEAQWEESSRSPHVGEPLTPGVLRLKSGFAHIEFYSGAMVILQGPAEFRLISRNEAYCSRGKLRATVPSQAKGFTIGSPKRDVVDLGTEFGLQVGDGDKTEVHVFEGKVELYAPGARKANAPHQDLITGESVQVEGPGPGRRIELNSAAFPSAQELATRAQREMRRFQREWLEGTKVLARDPRLVFYHTFQAEQTWSRTLRDQADGRREPRDGAIVGCSWVTGRWPGKQGLEFKRVSDRVRLNVPGDFDAITLAAWVRVDSLPNRFNSLIMTDGWDPLAPHWHISSDGRLELGVQGKNLKEGVHYLTPVVFTPEIFGRWVHLAVTYERDGQVSHYVDGKLLHQEQVRADHPLRFGPAEIGNWNIGTRRDKSSIRHFSGCIDEFLLFSAALSDQEIERLYTEGRPPS